MFTTLSGERYVGTWQKGQKHGRGRYVFKGGDFYDGDFVRNHAHGDGIYWYLLFEKSFVSQNKELVSWNRHLQLKQIILIFIWFLLITLLLYHLLVCFHALRYAATGNVFAGQFKEDKKCGRGVYVWQSGSRFEGYFKDNGIHGIGVFDFANGSKYQVM